jgi:hypothetical protein
MPLGRPITSRLVVLGAMGRIPVAGVAWQVLHYLEGLRRLGCEVYYVEDTGDWPYDPLRNTSTDDPSYTVNYIGELMARYGFSDRWAYRAPGQGRLTFGLSTSALAHVFEVADALINLSGSTILRDEHLKVPVRIYLETDPVAPQIAVASGNRRCIEWLAAHTQHFTYGENLGAPDCGVPVESFHYRPTRQPLVLGWWISADPPPGACFTTIGNWRQTGKDVKWGGETYTWSKHHEFLKFIDLPRRTSQPLELALALRGYAGEKVDEWSSLHEDDAEAVRQLISHGWRIKTDGRQGRTASDRYCPPYKNAPDPGRRGK